MIYLLGQIFLCLLLAAIAGWYVGWSWRGFREADRVEDLRRTLRATEEVKERELAEAERRAGELAGRVDTLERRAERLADELAEARRGDAEAGGQETGNRDSLSLADASGRPAVRDSDREHGGSEENTGAPDQDAATTSLATGLAELETLRRRVGELDEELQREARERREAELALQEKSASVAALQAELESLRSVTEGRAESVARLERRVLELEPLEDRLARKEDELEELASRLRRASEQADEGGSRYRALEDRSSDLEERLRERDRRVNELRNELNETIARLERTEAERKRLRERAEASDELREEARRYRTVASRSSAVDEQLEECRRRLEDSRDQLEEARTALQRQIDRNRKQEAIHQQVVANLQREAEETRRRAARAGDRPEVGTERARWTQVVAERDSRIAGLRRRLGELESHLEVREDGADDLTEIHGIGPKYAELLNSMGIRRFDQIAAWTEADVERIAERLGVFGGRIERDDWVGGARRHHLLKYGEPPAGPPEEWWLPDGD